MGRLCAMVTGVFLGHFVVVLQTVLSRGAYPFRDFFAIWSYAKLAVHGRAADLYDPAAMHGAQLALGLPTAEVLGLPITPEMPFPYPPSFLLLLWPLGWLSYWPAFALWIGVTLVCYLYLVGRNTRPVWLMLIWAVAAPTTVINLAFGQSGFLLAALLIGGLLLMQRRPILAGVLFGLLTFKPQFGLLVPVALLACGYWRCLAAACAAVTALIAGATLALGPAIWMIWLRSLPAYSAWFDSLTKFQALRVSVRDNVLTLGCPPDLAMLAQAAAIVGAAAVVWIAFRLLARRLAITLLVAATCLASPHGMIYDLPMLTGAVLLFLDQKLRDGAQFTPIEIAILLLTVVFPAALAWSIPLPISSAVLVLFISVVFVASKNRKGFATISSLSGGLRAATTSQA